MSKCPKCDSLIARFKMVPTKAQQTGSTVLWSCLSYNCPSCDAVLSVQIDPTMIRDEILDGITERLRNH